MAYYLRQAKSSVKNTVTRLVSASADAAMLSTRFYKRKSNVQSQLSNKSAYNGCLCSNVVRSSIKFSHRKSFSWVTRAINTQLGFFIAAN